MSIFQAIILGILQGLTEFLPVSSSGHLVLAQKFFGLETPPIFFDVMVHVGTLFAIVVYLRKDLMKIILGLKNKEIQKLLALVIVGTLPVVIVGFLLLDFIEEIFNSFLAVGISFLITAAILTGTVFAKKLEKNLEKMSWLDSIFIGLFQALAILPGVSRSGSTISAGLFRKIDRESAFKFSFFLAIPAIFGALILQLIQDKIPLDCGFSVGFLGFVFSAIFGLLALKILERVLIRGKFFFFAIYCFVLGMAVLLFLA
ncbi:MAG: undecaprenyl-diphosphatase [Parcubacteria group bacterium CG11_big_fil_rev_8_21_14_0_20_39_14]|nr:MAG: undecaprenyl-diphosphatase [Parcubacteria group bacterium CG11_big_fil_rev_8_21_14_0_20_39_14]PIS34979.1 MAG: undecaprenyl-diphosphatase [Parcubacteria group bacterium CG08_land_8_20_14_0_20_38_56]